MKRARIDWTCPRVQAVLLKYDREPARAAEYLGCGLSTVAQARMRLGLARRAPRIDWGPWDRLLGTRTDAALAALMSEIEGRDVSASTVAGRRTRLGVMACCLPRWTRENHP